MPAEELVVLDEKHRGEDFSGLRLDRLLAKRRLATS